MGLLSEGTALSWEETKKMSKHVRKHGILQFINLYRRVKDRQRDGLKWGDEIEYMIVRFDESTRRAQLSLKALPLLTHLQQREQENDITRQSTWRPEYAGYMIEGTPAFPYGHMMAHFNVVEDNMRKRRMEAMELLDANESILSLTAFPHIGAPNFTYPPYKPTPNEGASHSLFFPQEAIFNGHPRFATLTRNIRQRRKEKVIINIPIYMDTNTRQPFREDFASLGDDGQGARAAKDDHVYLDAMGFGMGCCCLQVTFQATNISEARLLYDQLTPLCPIVLALSASCPILRGHLIDRDCRWDVISASVDCRTREERGEEPLVNDEYRIHKSRYDSVSCYISPGNEEYNDIDLVINQEAYHTMVNAGIDLPLAKHIAHLFIRDSVSLFSEKVHQDDTIDTDHFENLQSTNWQTMRFKPPPPDSTIGWRVEFRPTEVQLTDFENAAYVVFVVLLTRVILSYNLNLLMPISKVDENMVNAQKRDACRQGKFCFRTDLFTKDTPREAAEKCKKICKNMATSCLGCNCVYMSINEIINGKGDDFPGLIPLIYNYLDNVEVDVDTMCTIKNYLSLIEKRASGDLQTTAQWMRKFVEEHPDYQHDSIVTELITYDLMLLAKNVTSGDADCPSLLGNYKSKTNADIPPAVANAVTKQTNNNLNTSSSLQNALH